MDATLVLERIAKLNGMMAVRTHRASLAIQLGNPALAFEQLRRLNELARKQVEATAAAAAVLADIDEHPAGQRSKDNGTEPTQERRRPPK